MRTALVLGTGIDASQTFTEMADHWSPWLHRYCLTDSW
jgi:hypothetical protein